MTRANKKRLYLVILEIIIVIIGLVYIYPVFRKRTLAYSISPYAFTIVSER